MILFCCVGAKSLREASGRDEKEARNELKHMATSCEKERNLDIELD